MKQEKINVLYAVDTEDNTKQSLMALPSGVRCPIELAREIVNDFFGEKVCDNDDAMYELIAKAIHNDEQIEYSYWIFFFDEVTMYVPDKKKKEKSNMDDIVTVTCYGKTEKMTRREALSEYLEGMRCCEGSEAERYETIYFQLLDGAMEASDMEY